MVRLTKSIVLVSCCVLLVSCACGCAATQKKDRPAGEAVLEPQALPRFADLPVPAGFKVMPEQSYAFETTGMRVGLLKYQGKATPDQVVNFYKEQMPMYNWELLNTVEYGERLMNFAREKETCIISILPKGSNSVFVSITFGPKAQGAAQKAQKPIK